ncbi:MAG: restriction endonuclease subunit S [Azoarcus sp.]|jgi:type I restriction enzyme S subunit|nr:restriction endonuclease subunit S [Azoarcus sp.]
MTNKAMSIPNIDIRPDHWRIVRDILRKHVPQYEVWAFGSRAKWTAKQYSDLDLAIITNRPLPLEVSASLADDFSESDLPWKVDVVDWASTSESFRKIVERDRVRVQKAGVAVEWRETTWGEEVSLEYGKAIRGYQEARGKFRVFGSNGPIGWTDNALTDGPGVILGRKGAYRGVQFSREPFWVIDTAYFVVPKTDLDMRWLYYAIRHYKLGEIDDGSPIPSTTRAAVYVRELTVPPLEEQRAIAEILGTLDDRIDNLRQTNATLEAIAAALFKSWFVDFDGIAAEDTVGATHASPLHIPKGWRAATVNDVCEAIFSGGTPDTRKPEYWNGELPWFSSGETREQIIIETEKHITQAGVDGSSTRAARPGDILIAAAGQGHTRGQTSYCAIDTYINQSVVSARANTNKCSPVWLYYNLERRYDEMRMLSDSHSSRGSFTTKLLATMPLALPPADVIHKFGSIAEPLFSLQIKNSQQIATLATLRDTLLPHLISGRLRIEKTTNVAEGLA